MKITESQKQTLAERVGFEPTNTVRCYTLSRRAPSTARPPLLAVARVPERAYAIKSDSTELFATRVGLTRAILALALRAHCVRPKALQAILSNPRTRLGVTHFPGVRLRPLGHLSCGRKGTGAGLRDQIRQHGVIATRVGLTRAILALALRAHCVRPKSLQAILSNPRTRLGVTHFPGVRLRPLGHLSSRPQGYRSGPRRSNLGAS